MLQATDEYRDDEDSLAGFYPGLLRDEPGGWVTRKELRDVYLGWCELDGTDALRNIATLYTSLEERGVRGAMRRGARGFVDVALGAAPDHEGAGGSCSLDKLPQSEKAQGESVTYRECGQGAAPPCPPAPSGDYEGLWSDQ